VTYFTISGVVLLTLLILSALISGSEVAFFSLTKDDLKNTDEPKQVDKTIISLLEYPKRLLATILILNNTVNVALVTLATFVTWKIVGTNTPEGSVLVILTFIVTFMIVFFGEVIPKVYATQNNLKFARMMAKPLAILSVLLRPFSAFLRSFADFIEKRIERKGYDVSLQELNQALEITTDEETTAEEKEIIKGIMTFGTISVRQVMQSRIDIQAAEITDDFGELMDRVNTYGYSRIPVFQESLDNIEGVLYIKDLLPHLDEGKSFKWQKLLRPGFFVPENKKIDTLLRDFQERRVHIAIVVDEYGGTSGLITLEDVIEEIVGEIEDEYDETEISFRQISAKTYIFEGKTSINDFCKVVGDDLAVFESLKGESESLGGLLLEINKVLPNTGEEITIDKYTFRVMAVDERRIKKIKVIINTPTDEKPSD
jgi:gliding motility-associated protein GldE